MLNPTRTGHITCREHMLLVLETRRVHNFSSIKHNLTIMPQVWFYIAQYLSDMSSRKQECLFLYNSIENIPKGTDMTSYILIISENIFMPKIWIKQSNTLKILPLIAPAQFLTYSSWLGGQLETLPLLQQPIQTDKYCMYQPQINHQTCSTKRYFLRLANYYTIFMKLKLLHKWTQINS